jgi:phosphoserine phosphatase
MSDRLPSWRPGPTRDAILAFLDGARDVPADERVAYVDNDGTMWCEKPTYVQFDFFVDAFLGRYRHRALGVPVRGVIYQPMLELIDELRALDFTVGIVTGGGTEFVRRVSKRFYGVEPGMVVGTLIGYRFDRDDDGRPVVRRTISQIGKANEGGAKLENIQSQVGRAPILAVGNSGGDREMLEWARANRHGGLAVLIDHDDADREYAYEGQAATFEEDEAITEVAARLDWVVVSMRRDWETIFATQERQKATICGPFGSG